MQSCVRAPLGGHPPRHVVRRRPHLRQVDHLAGRADDDPAEKRCAVLAGRAVENAGHVCEENGTSRAEGGRRLLGAL